MLVYNDGNGIGIVGTRRRDSYEDYLKTEQIFFKIYKAGDLIISGGCPQGGDRFAEVIAKKFGIPILIFYPDWYRIGKQAGFKRNSKIAEYSSKALIASVAPDRKGGTEDTIYKYLKLYSNLIII